MSDSDTIFALATAPGRAGVAVVRLSGARSRAVVELLCPSVAPPRMMAYRNISWEDDVIDQALVVWFEKGASYTGEEMAEFHLHGGRAVIARLLDVLASMDGLRQAEAGEFTRRAMEAGRLDLAQVEGIADLIDAETEVQRKVALQITSGALSETVASLRKRTVHALALIEASIDFADEEDAPIEVGEQVDHELKGLRADLGKLVEAGRVGERVREGFRVALVGPPNAGKSTLLNAIAGREAAIASPIAGTTRDVIEVACDLEGLPVILVDMAGLRDTTDPVEAEGVRRARLAATEADLRLFLVAPDTDVSDIDEIKLEGDIVVGTKADLEAGNGDVCVSAKSYEGVPELLEIISSRLRPLSISSLVSSRSRQSSRLKGALAALELASLLDPPEILSQKLRDAVVKLDEIVGIVDVEDVLGEIFSRFCIGK